MLEYTKLKDHNRKDLREVIPLQKPYTLLVEPSSLCNFRCVQCFQSISDETWFSKNRMNMSMECFNKIKNDMKSWEGDKLKVLKLSLYGEPFLNPNFCEMLRIARESGIAERIETTSNVSLLTEEISEKLVAYGLDYIRVSIYSAMQERHREVTHSGTSIGQIHKNLEELQNIKRKHNSKTPFVAVKMLDTFGEENELFQKMYEDVADELYIDQPHNWIAYEDKSFVESLYRSDAEKVKKSLEKSKSNRLTCTLPFFTLAVRSNGDVSPCCIDWVGETKIGNVLSKGLRDIWNGDSMFEFRRMQLLNRKHENSSCRNCEIYTSDYYTKDNIDGFPVSKLREGKE